ncbi:MAG TPA: hypothetical protein VFL59_15940 [Candidatus Nanopelagicales bacterium]|nr:hypothetical protein [Candidatus Nanopelagicales bacterium]
MSGRGQVSALLSLRWQMMRARPLRTAIALAALVAVGIVVLVVITSASVPLGRVSSESLGVEDVVAGAPVDRTGEVAALLPSAMLAFALLCLIAPVAAGGGYEIIPEAELVAYPIKVSTLVRGSLVLAPLNIAWYLQVLILTSASAYAVRGPGGPTLPIVVLLAFMAACTSVGQALGWALVGVRRTRSGRRTTWAMLAVALAVAGWVIATDRGASLLDASPTKKILGAQISASLLDAGGFLWFTGGLLVATFLGYLAAVRIASWALRRPGDLGVDGPLARPVERRPDPASAKRALLAVDRASVWRSPPLRRGLLVLAILPIAAAAVASLPWSSIALLPPLVSSGAALLFGVNALSLDGTGALWISTLPHDPDLVLRSKARVVLEVVSTAVLLVLVGAGLRASSAPDPVDLVCVLGASISCTALVVATCMRLSVTRPHRAELRGARDTPAPPGTMALYSARLAVVTTTVGLLFSVATFGAPWQYPVLLTLGLVLWAARSWQGTRRRWSRPELRARVVATVASG